MSVQKDLKDLTMLDDELNDLIKDVDFATPKQVKDEDYIPDEDILNFSDEALHNCIRLCPSICFFGPDISLSI